MAASPFFPEILGGPAAEREIKNLLSACSRARLAVAYWGSGAVARLGLGAVRTRTVDIEITCDLMSGACNPNEVVELIKLFGADRVRTRDGLHAKAWITDAGCVLGSSNASANGLGHEADETLGLIEANLSFPGMPQPMWAAWEGWYEASARTDSVPIDDEMLKEAHERWAARRAVRDGPLASSRSGGSLLAALRDNPGRFRDKPLKVSIYEHDGYSPEAERGVEEAKAEYKDTGGRGTLDAYESWRVPAGTYILDFDWDPSRRTASLDGIWKIVSDRPYRRLKGTSITLCTGAPSFEGLSAAKEKTALAQAATKVMRAHGQDELTVTAEEFGRRLAAIP
jgi:hypothetical protein